MSDSESLDYLQPDFDPRTLTVPRLRSILVTYNVPYPATAKKGQLIDLFTEHVTPQSKKILAQRARAKRSSKGIVDVESSQSSSTEFMDQMAPPRPAARSRSPRKSSRYQDSEEPEQPEPLSPRKRSVRSVSRQAPSDTDTDPDVVKSARPSSRRTVTPHIKLEAPAEEDSGLLRESRLPDRSDNVFTDYNPFQSGSSPPQGPKTPGNRRRTTGGPESVLSKSAKVASAARRRTDGPAIIDEPSHKVSRTFEFPVSALKAPRTPEQPATVEAGEEFTPDAQLELSQEEASQGAVARQRPQAVRSGRSLATPLWVLLVTLFGFYAAWYRQEKVKVGYCGLGRSPNQILPPEVQEKLPDWAQMALEPQCEPCPPHAYCYDDFTVRCDDDYILKPHPLSLGGLVPLPPTCEPDGVKARRVKFVADKAVEELRERRAKFECGEPIDEQGQQAETAAIEEDVLKEMISEKRSKKMGQQEFDDLWAAALGEIQDREEVEVETVAAADPGAVPNTVYSSTSHARVPLTCAVRTYFRRGLERYRYGIAAVVGSLLALFSGFLYVRSAYRQHKAMSEMVPRLVDVVLEKLATQKELVYEGSGQDDPFLFLPNLRDDVLRAVHKLKQRERIWERVRAVVEQNSNVRQGQREGRNGEIGRAWEWIGPTTGGDGGRRRTLGGRVSWGPGVRTEEDGFDSPGPRTPGSEVAERRTSLHQKWQEGGRPAF